MTAILERCPRCHLLRRAVPEDACCAVCGTVDDLVPSKHDDEILCEACEHTLDALHQCPRCLCCHQSPVACPRCGTGHPTTAHGTTIPCPTH